jgi:hypothetical protein
MDVRIMLARNVEVGMYVAISTKREEQYGPNLIEFFKVTKVQDGADTDERFGNEYKTTVIHVASSGPGTITRDISINSMILVGIDREPIKET